MASSTASTCAVRRSDPFLAAPPQLRSDDDADYHLRLAHLANSARHTTLRIPDQIGQCWCPAGTALEIDGAGGQCSDLRQVFIERRQSGQDLQSRLRQGGFDDQPIALLPHHRVLAWKLEASRNPDSLILSVLE